MSASLVPQLELGDGGPEYLTVVFQRRLAGQFRDGTHRNPGTNHSVLRNLDFDLGTIVPMSVSSLHPGTRLCSTDCTHATKWMFIVVLPPGRVRGAYSKVRMQASYKDLHWHTPSCMKPTITPSCSTQSSSGLTSTWTNGPTRLVGTS